MPTEEQIREHTTPRWPLVRMTDEELAEDDPHELIADLMLTDGEMVALKVILIAWTRIDRGPVEEQTREERWAVSAAESTIAKVSLALKSFLPGGTHAT